MMTANARKIAGLLDALAEGDVRRLRLAGGQLKGRVTKEERVAGAEHWLKTRGEKYPLLARALREALELRAIREQALPARASIKPRATFHDLQLRLIAAY